MSQAIEAGEQSPALGPDATALYRFYDRSDGLLYVGQSRDPSRRMGDHKAKKEWWAVMATMRLEWHETLEMALEAEKIAIETEKPLHNIQHNRGAATVTTTTKKKTTIDDVRTLSPGYAVGIALREPIAKLNYFVGEVQAVDDIGIRITHVDWLVGLFSGFDCWFPWANVLGITEIATPAHSMYDWHHSASKAQGLHNDKPAAEPIFGPVDDSDDDAF